jgi:hypothetical protein
MADPNELYKNFAHISDIQTQTLTGGGYGMPTGPSRYQHTAQVWSVAGKNDDDGIWYRYYFVQFDSILRTFVAGTFKINGYFMTCHLVDEQGAVLPSTVLVEVTPDTTQGSTSYTTSMSQSFSASGGFFGDTPTFDLGTSVSFGHSVTRSIPDITINNTSLSADGQDASWNFGIAENANAQSDSMEFTVQMLFRTPTTPEDQSKQHLRLDFKVVVEDHDNNGSAYYNRIESALRPHLGEVQLNKFDDRGCALSFPALNFRLKAPVLPHSLSAEG